MKLGFIGMGVMGTPMAINLARAGANLVVWNRTPAKCEPLRDLGAVVVASASEVFRAADCVIVMLANEAALDAVLMRDRPEFQSMVSGRTLIVMGTTSPAHSRQLEAATVAAGGRYVEAPVSGSRTPAESGQLVGMMAGAPGAVADVRPLLKPMCAEIFECGTVPRALLTKLAVNLFLITMVTGLAEAASFAEQNALDLQLLARILDAGPMSSSVSRIKMARLVERDYSVQASIADVAVNARLVAQAARNSGSATPLLDAANQLFTEAEVLGLGALDMAAVIEAIAARNQQGNQVQGGNDDRDRECRRRPRRKKPTLSDRL